MTDYDIDKQLKCHFHASQFQYTTPQTSWRLVVGLPTN